MRHLRAVFVVLPCLWLAACGAGDPFAATPVPAPSPQPSPSPTARYRVTFEATWDANSHPTDIPSNPHFSSLVGGTHRNSVTFWRDGGFATEGIRLMSERGRQTPLDLEVNAAKAAGDAEHLLLGDDVPLSPGSTSLDFEVSVGYPLVTLVTMVAPSPDWFLGVSGLSLLENGAWLQERTVDLYPWDAGTDSGGTYRAADRVTSPPEPIHRLTGPPLSNGGTVAPMGRFVFRRLS